MNWAQFKDPLGYLYPDGVASWALTQDVAGSNHFVKYNNFCH